MQVAPINMTLLNELFAWTIKQPVLHNHAANFK